MGRNHRHWRLSCNHSSGSSSSGNNNPGAPSPGGRGRVLIFYCIRRQLLFILHFCSPGQPWKGRIRDLLGLNDSRQADTSWMDHSFLLHFVVNSTSSPISTPVPAPSTTSGGTTPRYQAHQRPLAIPPQPPQPPVSSSCLDSKTTIVRPIISRERRAVIRARAVKRIPSQGPVELGGRCRPPKSHHIHH